MIDSCQHVDLLKIRKKYLGDIQEIFDTKEKYLVGIIISGGAGAH